MCGAPCANLLNVIVGSGRVTLEPNDEAQAINLFLNDTGGLGHTSKQGIALRHYAPSRPTRYMLDMHHVQPSTQ